MQEFKTASREKYFLFSIYSHRSQRKAPKWSPKSCTIYSILSINTRTQAQVCSETSPSETLPVHKTNAKVYGVKVRPTPRRPHLCLRDMTLAAHSYCHYPQVTVLCSFPVFGFAFSIRQEIVNRQYHSCRHIEGFLTKPVRGRLSFSSQLPGVNDLLWSHTGHISLSLNLFY